MRRMQKEFADMLQQTTTGKLLQQITVRDFNLGSTFPIIRSVTASNIQVDDDNMIEVSWVHWRHVSIMKLGSKLQFSDEQLHILILS